MKRKFLMISALMFAVSFNGAYAMFDNDKPLVVTITSDSCTYCKQLDPVIKDLKEEYDGQVKFVTLTVSSKSSLEEAKQIAEENGISGFFEHNKSTFPTVGYLYLCPSEVKVEKIFIGETRKEVYEKALNEFLTNSSEICSL